MSDIIEFKNKKELYNKVLPALFSKVKETRRLGLNYITEKDVWNYLVDNEWKKRNDLELFDLISDILSVDNYRLYDYVVENIKKLKEKEKIDIKGDFKIKVSNEEDTNEKNN